MMVKISARDSRFLEKLFDTVKPLISKEIPRNLTPAELSQAGQYASQINANIRPGRMAAPSIFDTVANMPSRSNILSAALNTMGLLSIAGTAAGGASLIYNAVKDKVKSHSAYKAMFDEFPELKDADRGQVDKYWTVLRDYSPELTQNPLVAGQFVSNMMQYGMRGIDHNTIGQLASIHNDLNRDRTNNMNMLGGLAGNLIREDYKGMIEEIQG